MDYEPLTYRCFECGQIVPILDNTHLGFHQLPTNPAVRDLVETCPASWNMIPPPNTPPMRGTFPTRWVEQDAAMALDAAIAAHDAKVVDPAP